MNKTNKLCKLCTEKCKQYDYQIIVRCPDFKKKTRRAKSAEDFRPN